MEELMGASNLKLNMITGIKEIYSRTTIAENSSEFLEKANSFYPECGLYKSIKSYIFMNLNEHLLREVESIHSIGSKYTELAVCASARKLITLPEMDSVIFNLKEEMDEILGSYILQAPRLPTLSADSRVNRESISSEQHSLWVDDDSIPVDVCDINKASNSKSEAIKRKGKNETILVKLSRASLTEIFETPCWTNFKVLFRKSLSDDSSAVFFQALKLHARFLLSSSNVAMLESFVNLKTSVLDQFVRGKCGIDVPNFNEGIVLTKLSHIRLLRTMNLMVKFFRDESKNYVRLPIKLIEEIVGGMVEVITFFPDESRALCPFHLLSVLDPKALWMKLCFYYTHIRNILLKKLSEDSKLIVYLLKGLLSWLNRLNINNKRTCLNNNLDQVISKKHIKFAAFSHSLYSYSFFMNCEKGRNMLWNIDGGATFQEVLRSIVLYLNHSSSCQTAILLKKILHNIISNVKNGILSNNIVNVLVVNPLFCAHQNMLTNNDSDNNILIECFVIDLLVILMKSKIGRDKFLTIQKYKLDLDYVDVCPARIFLHYATSLLKKTPKESFNLLQNVLISCALLSCSPKGLIEIEDSDVIPLLAIFYRQLKGENEVTNFQNMVSYGNLFKEESSILEVVTNCLIRFTAYSGRVWLIEKEGILLSILNDILKLPVIQWNHSWFKKLLISSTLMTSGHHALVGENLQSLPLSDLWKCRILDDNSPPGKTEETLQHELSKIFCLCSTLRGVKAILVEQEGSEVTLTEASNSPSSIQEVLEFTLGINRESSGNITLKEEFSNCVDLNEVYLGLRILRFMMSSLDITLLLQNKFLVQEHLMKICNGNIFEDKGELIMDDITIICEQILRNSFLVDYGNERNYLSRNMALRSPGNVHPKSLMTASVSHLEHLSEDWILYSNSYCRSHSRHTPRRLKNDLVKFLGSTRHGLRDINWLNQLRKAHRSIFIGSNSPELKNNVLVELLEEVQKAYANIYCNVKFVKFQWSEHSFYSLSPEDLLGVKLAIRYGAKLSLLQPTPLVQSNLAQFIKSAYGALKIVQDEFWGFDWFLATVFLLCCGNIDRCQLFINNFVKLNMAPFLWVTYGEVLSKLNSVENNYRNDFIFLLIQQVELILSIEVPKVFAAFQQSAASVGVLVHQWMSQCFCNILDWSEIKNFLCLIIINEPDFIVYFCVAILLHLEPFILHTLATSAEHLWEQLKINPVGNFHLGNYLFFIEKLHKIHHSNVMRSISNCTADLNKYQ